MLREPERSRESHKKVGRRKNQGRVYTLRPESSRTPLLESRTGRPRAPVTTEGAVPDSPSRVQRVTFGSPRVREDEIRWLGDLSTKPLVTIPLIDLPG